MLRWVFILHKHIGLVLAFLLTLSTLTHASILAPVRMPSISIKDQKEQILSSLIRAAHDILLHHTPTGHSSD